MTELRPPRPPPTTVQSSGVPRQDGAGDSDPWLIGLVAVYLFTALIAIGYFTSTSIVEERRADKCCNALVESRRRGRR